MIAVEIHDAKVHFIELLYKVEAGEEVIIEDSGKQVAKIIPLNKGNKERILGLEKGKIKISNDFDAPLPEEILKEFYQ